MSIFFDFNVGPTGRRFRRAVDADKYEIGTFQKSEETEMLFGEVDIGGLIELSTLAICLMNESKEVTGFLALNDHPNIPAVDPAGWEEWIRNMFQKYYLSRDTLFIHFMCCKGDIAEYFLEEALMSVFRNDVYLLYIAIVVPPNCPTELLTRYKVFSNRGMRRYNAKRDDDTQHVHHMVVARREDFCPKLRIRRAVEEDNDDIVEILDKRCPKLKQLYGEFYISELIGRHPDSQRQIIVAEFQERAVGLMCLNTMVNYEMLQDTYELKPYHGLIKATPLEKEEYTKENALLKIFGEPIMAGQWGPYDNILKLQDVNLSDVPSLEHPKAKQYSKSTSKVNFGAGASMRKSFDNLYFHHSDDVTSFASREFDPISESTSWIDNVLMEDDPFDYDIVNIEPKLLTVPANIETLLTLSGEAKQKENDDERELWAPYKKSRQRRKSSMMGPYQPTISNKFTGPANAFVIELYGLRDDFDQRQAYDMLEAAFELMKDKDYCIIRVPCSENSFPLLQHFSFVPSKSSVACEYALYIAHRNSVLGKFRVRRAELPDIPQLATFLQLVEGKETVWTVENCLLDKEQHQVYLFLCGMSIVGFGIVEPPQQVDFIRATVNLDAHHNHKYHFRSHGVDAGFATLKVVLAYPVFEPHFRFFAREMMRLTGSGALIWLTAYRNKWVLHKANSITSAMMPMLPRMSRVDCVNLPELAKLTAISEDLMAFSTWFINKKLTSVPKVNVDARIVIIGASRTAMGFLNTLLFSNGTAYLTFTNVTLISPNGLEYMRHSKPTPPKMFPKYQTSSDKFLKSVPYTYYVNIIQGTLAEINKQQKFIKLTNGSNYYYDKLFLLLGKQFQYPDYLKVVFERDHNIKIGNVPPYVPLDVKPTICAQTEMEILNTDSRPDNVFVVNNIAIANKALNHVQAMSWQDDFTIVVYGDSIQAYCCLSALLDIVPPTRIVFVDCFPTDNPYKTRVSVFCNEFVDQTVQECISNLKIKVYRSYTFEKWSVDSANRVTHVEFVSDFQLIRIPCNVFFYYGMRGLDARAFVAVNKCGMAYDGGILIDHAFRTKDPAIYAAGPCTRYHRRYNADSKRHKYYDSYEIGEKLGQQIRNDVDPLFNEKVDDKELEPTTESPETVSFDCGSDHEPSVDASLRTSFEKKLLLQQMEKPPEQYLPQFIAPIVTHCMLPGDLQYLEVRPPGRKTPHHYIQSLSFNGYVMETYKQGYFKLHLTEDLVVDGITCLTTEKYNLENFKNLYGLSATILNNVHFRYGAYKLDDFYAFFRAPWAFFLYHEGRDEMFALIKELLPHGASTGQTLKEALYAVGSRLSNLSYKMISKYRLRANFEKSAHIEAITKFVMEWLSENDILLPMYLQPSNKTYCSWDLGNNPFFIGGSLRKRKRDVKHFLLLVLGGVLRVY